jgi:uncharacterized protein (TIGR02996 family)
MSSIDTFLVAIREPPENDPLRLVFSDGLEDQLRERFGSALVLGW